MLTVPKTTTVPRVAAKTIDGAYLNTTKSTIFTEEFTKQKSALGYLDSAIERYHDVAGGRHIQRATAGYTQGSVWSHVKAVCVDYAWRSCIHALITRRKYNFLQYYVK